MQIDAINTVERFLALRQDWEAVYAADPEAQFFLSWTWYSRWIRDIDGDWIILAARPGGEGTSYVGFFPLRVRVKAKQGGGVQRELVPAGNRAADYTGILCTPAAQARAIPAFARHIKTLEWLDLNLECFSASPERTRLFLGEFPSRDFAMRGLRTVSAADGIDNGICPYVQLPADWDCYLGTALGSNTRQKARRFLRKADQADQLRIAPADSSSIERDLDILFHFWTLKWGPKKGDNAAVITRVLRRMVTHCFHAGCLFMPVLWRGTEPLGALAILIDQTKRSLLFYVSGCDTSTNNPPPGFLLHAYSIRHAIESGFTTYDFLRGNEPYKYAFGPQERRISHIMLRAKRAVMARPVPNVFEAARPIWQPPTNPFAPRFDAAPGTGRSLSGQGVSGQGVGRPGARFETRSS